MAKDLSKELEKLHLTEEEEVVIGKDSQDGDQGNTTAKVSLMMVGKLLTKADKEKVLQGRPWFFDNQLLVLKEITGEEQISEITLNSTPCWFRVYDMPFAKRSATFARDIGECMGEFLEFDDTDPLGLDNFMRVKVMIDIGKPLRRGAKIATSANSSKWVDIKYERLGDFCYYCGKLGHVDRDCNEIEESKDELKEMVYKYGPWLRASSLKRGRVSKDEIDKEKVMLGRLKTSQNGRKGGQKEAVVTKLGSPNDEMIEVPPQTIKGPGLCDSPTALQGEMPMLNKTTGQVYMVGTEAGDLAGQKMSSWRRIPRVTKNNNSTDWSASVGGDREGWETKKRFLEILDVGGADNGSIDEHKRLSEWIPSVLRKLHAWSKATFGNIRRRLKQAEKRLSDLQAKVPDALILAQCDTANWKPIVAEASASLFGLQVARRFWYGAIILESDSLEVVNTIINGWTGESPIFLIYDDIVALRISFDGFVCSYVKRNGNGVAHYVARMDVAVGSERLWLDSIPQSICNIAASDLI
ncbi:hypothetical protein RDABS01_030294 [Bienertia sinuspersici]